MSSVEEQKQSTVKKRYAGNRRLCCVVDCKNTQQNAPHLDFYMFPSKNKLYPHKLARYNNWVNAIRLAECRGSKWVPSASARICSEHFVGNKKSEDPRGPSYNPTIFPDIYKKQKNNSTNQIDRYKSFLKRQSKPHLSKPVKMRHLESSEEETTNIKQETTIDEHFNLKIEENNQSDMYQCIERVDESVQVDFFESNDIGIVDVFICNRYLSNGKCDAETLACRPLKIKIEPASCTVKNKTTQTDEVKSEENYEVNFPGFHMSIKKEEQLLDLADVSQETSNWL